MTHVSTTSDLTISLALRTGRNTIDNSRRHRALLD
jgi:hypothetical protein